MRKLFMFLIALASIIFAVCSPAHAFGCNGWAQMAGGNGCNSSIAASIVLTVDATVGGSSTSATPTVTISTTNSNDVLYICVDSNGTPVTSVTSPSLTWSARTNANVPFQGLYTFYAIASGPLTGEVITAHNTSSAFSVLDVIAISGANTSSPFDGTAVTHAGASSDPLSITTTHPNTAILGFFKTPGSTPTAGSGFTQYGAAASFHVSEYKIVSTTQSGLSVGMTTGSGTATRGIVDAITQ